MTIVFHEGTDIYRARALVGERLARAAAAIPPGLRHARPRADRHGARRGLPVPGHSGASGSPLADGAADDPRLVRRLPAPAGPRRDRDQLARRRAEDLPGRARPRRLAAYRPVADRRLQRPADEQRQRRRRLPRPRGRGPVHPGREPGAQDAEDIAAIVIDERERRRR